MIHTEFHKSKRVLPFGPRYDGIVPGDQHSQSFHQLQMLLPCLGFDADFMLLPPYPSEAPHQLHLQICPDTWIGEICRHRVCVVSSKHFWRAALQETLISCSRPSSFALDDITVPYSFIFRFEPVTYRFRSSCIACLLKVLLLKSSPSASPRSHKHCHQCGLTRARSCSYTRPRRVVPTFSSSLYL